MVTTALAALVVSAIMRLWWLAGLAAMCLAITAVIFAVIRNYSSRNTIVLSLTTLAMLLALSAAVQGKLVALVLLLVGIVAVAYFRNIVSALTPMAGYGIYKIIVLLRGDFTIWVDFTIFALGVAIAWGFVMLTLHLLPDRDDASSLMVSDNVARSTGVVGAAILAIFLIPGWVALSLADIYFYPKAPVFAQHQERPSLRPVTSVGIALSGGGYRAALFHAGVVAELRDIGIYPQAISTVSGGSIFGAFYSLGGEPEEFARVIKEHRLDLKRSFTNLFTLARLMASTRIPFTDASAVPRSNYSRLSLQADSLDRAFFNGITFRSASGRSRCALLLCATDLVHGRAIGMLPDIYLQRAVLPSPLRTTMSSRNLADVSMNEVSQAGDWTPGGERLSMLVAASGAFPGAFDPYPVRSKHRTRDNAAFWEELIDLFDTSPLLTERDLLLCDGGVIDNQGSGLFKMARSALLHGNTRFTPFNVGLLIESDGSALYTTAAPSATLAQVSRAIDTVYLSTGETSLHIENGDPSLNIVTLSPTELQRARLDLVMEPSCTPGKQCLSLDEIGPEAIGELSKLLLPTQRFQDGNPFLNSVQRSRSDDYELCVRLSRRIEQLLETFRDTSTLEDRLSDDVVDRIFLLGRVQVLLKRAALLHHLREQSPLRPQ